MLQEQNQKKAKLDDGKHTNIDEEIRKNKHLQEFMETMKPSSQVTSWEKIGIDKSIEDKGQQQQTEEDSHVQGNSLLAHALALKGDDKDEAPKLLIENESDDEYSTFNTNKDEGEEEKMMSLDNLENANTTMGMDDDDDDNNNDEAENEKRRNLAQNEQVSDFDWFKQRRIRIKESEAEARDKLAAAAAEQKANTEAKEETQPEPVVPQKTDEERAVEKINQTGRLFLRNILYTSREDDFKKLAFQPLWRIRRSSCRFGYQNRSVQGVCICPIQGPQERCGSIC